MNHDSFMGRRRMLLEVDNMATRRTTKVRLVAIA
jgi:hypothetical protein